MYLGLDKLLDIYTCACDSLGFYCTILSNLNLEPNIQEKFAKKNNVDK